MLRLLKSHDMLCVVCAKKRAAEASAKILNTDGYQKIQPMTKLIKLLMWPAGFHAGYVP